MDAMEALYTTRAMRRVKPDPIPEEVQKKILDAAIRAPSGGNMQTWRFLLVDDPGVKGRLGPIYRECMDTLWNSIYKARLEEANADSEDPENAQFLRVYRSADHLAQHFEEYPLFLFAFCQFDNSGGSIWPAVWNACLAARTQGVGSAVTSAFFFKLDEMKGVLGVPDDDTWHFSACVSFGYPTGRWGVAPRVPAHEVSYRNSWDGDLGFEIPEPLFSLD